MHLPHNFYFESKSSFDFIARDFLLHTCNCSCLIPASLPEIFCKINYLSRKGHSHQVALKHLIPSWKKSSKINLGERRRRTTGRVVSIGGKIRERIQQFFELHFPSRNIKVLESCNPVSLPAVQERNNSVLGNTAEKTGGILMLHSKDILLTYTEKTIEVWKVKDIGNFR